jgi:hypothetical protein
LPRCLATSISASFSTLARSHRDHVQAEVD